MPVLLEVPVFNIASAVDAEQCGAHRIELCDNPAEGGTTPSAGVIEQTLKEVSIEVFVMIRPRGGNFVYSEAEYAAMQRDIALCKQLGVKGVVFGILTTEGKLDVSRCRQLIEQVRPMQVTLHRAFDVTRDATEALEDAVAAGFNRILTSGQQPTAAEGAALIASLVQRAGNRIIIMAGSGISTGNVIEVVRQTGVREIHCSARVWTDDVSLPEQKVFFNSALPGKSGIYCINKPYLKEILTRLSTLS